MCEADHLLRSGGGFRKTGAIHAFPPTRPYDLERDKFYLKVKVVCCIETSDLQHNFVFTTAEFASSAIIDELTFRRLTSTIVDVPNR